MRCTNGRIYFTFITTAWVSEQKPRTIIPRTTPPRKQGFGLRLGCDYRYGYRGFCPIMLVSGVVHVWWGVIVWGFYWMLIFAQTCHSIMITGDTPGNIHPKITPRQNPGCNPMSRLRSGPRLVGRIWSGVRVSASCQIFALTLNGHIKTAEQRTVIQQYGDWYTGRWWVGCCIWYSEEEPGWPPSPLRAVPNVTAHSSTTSVPTSDYSMWHYNCLHVHDKGLRNFLHSAGLPPGGISLGVIYGGHISRGLCPIVY